MVELSLCLNKDTNRCTWMDASGQFHSPITLPLEMKPSHGTIIFVMVLFDNIEFAEKTLSFTRIGCIPAVCIPCTKQIKRKHNGEVLSVHSESHNNGCRSVRN
jgi:hypothetical protein